MKKARLAWVLLILVHGAVAGAATAVAAEESDITSAEAPPPYFARNKAPLPAVLIKQKREGRYFTAFPAIGWDPDTKFNFGAAGQFFDNGKKDSPFFAISPYRMLLQPSFILTTGKAIEAILYYDQPYLLDTPWRIRGEFQFSRNPFRNYFGIGGDGLQLVSPVTGEVFGSYSSYKDALGEQENGETNERYDNYKYTGALLRGTAEYDLLGGYVRPLFGFQFGRVLIGDYTGDEVSGAVQKTTHLKQDCLAGLAIGCDGGWDNFVKVGISVDTRDFEPDPGKGIFLDTAAELSPKFLGSSFNYGRWTNNFRFFVTPLKYGNHRIVLADRAYFGWQFGDVPFYSMNTLANTERDRTGLGGFRSLRGYKLDRFIGPVQIMNNFEIRWSFWDFRVFKQDFKLAMKPFFDVGRVFDGINSVSLNDWKIGFGDGLTLVWNLATVINFDLAWGDEGRSFYMEVGTQF